MSRLYSARVRDGVVVLDGVTLPDGAAVTIAVNDEKEADVELNRSRDGRARRSDHRDRSLGVGVVGSSACRTRSHFAQDQTVELHDVLWRSVDASGASCG